ncbi:MAG: DUF413 domain-containing protein [Verrucomicrobiales bacterium]|nr:DUF413 domain-containing protein [Verrucomicrobiales bacterium]
MYWLINEAMVLSKDDWEYLKKYGAWFESLESGEIEPKTELQKRFVSVCAGEIEPRHPPEQLWIKVRAAREIYGNLERLENESNELKKKVALQNTFIADLKSEVEELKRRNKKLIKLADGVELNQQRESPKSEHVHETCIQCWGDGGAGGRCPRCGGNGLEP